MKATWESHEASAPRRAARWAASDRGWLFVKGEDICRGHYLDYGSDHYRTPESRETNPGNVHAVSVRTGEFRYFETPALAKAWIEALNPDITRVVERFRNGDKPIVQASAIAELSRIVSDHKQAA